MRIRSLLLTAVLVSASSPASAASISALYVFGDSLSDNGNLSAIADASVPGPGPTIPAPPYAQGRASNGLLAVEYLAQFLGLAPLLPVAVGGTNFAVIGAATGFVPIPGGGTADNVAELLGLALPVPTGILTAQLPLFLSMLNGPIDPDALFVIWGGPNDVFINPSEATAVQAASNIGTAVDTLYAAGARRFLVPNMPDLGLAPGAGADALALTQLTLLFNTQLAGNLAAREGLPDMQLTPFDAFALFNAMVMNPALYGLTNIEDACVQGNVLFAVRVCGMDDEDGYLFWDDTHPTTVGHNVLGGGFADAIDQQVPVPEPGTLTLAAVGLASLVLRRRRAA